jgi:hypothetical protein
MDVEGVLAIILIFGGGAVTLIAYSPVGKAIADRIRRKGLIIQDPEVIEDLNQLRGEVTELHERLDFAERLLSDRSESGR